MTNQNEEDSSWASDPEPAPAENRSLGEMMADARAKSRGQGVVQGSTIFFKNLAESIGHSNRNLKIGLAFLAATVVMITVLIFYVLVVYSRKQQAQDADLKKLPHDVQEYMRKESAALRQEQAQVTQSSKRELDAALLSVEASRRETADVRKQVEDLTKHHNELVAGYQKLLETYQADQKVIRSHLQQHALVK